MRAFERSGKGVTPLDHVHGRSSDLTTTPFRGADAVDVAHALDVLESVLADLALRDFMASCELGLRNDAIERLADAMFEASDVGRGAPVSA